GAGNRAGLNLMRPRMQFFEGSAGMQAALEDILRIPAGSVTFSLWPARAAVEHADEGFSSASTRGASAKTFNSRGFGRVDRASISPRTPLGAGDRNS
ncbi:MAG: hypothetical protein LRY54_01935, partial [Alphaproteobacteria bacterium]|nr:hypothetical protein [Alphaproteobacteria bacterium]